MRGDVIVNRKLVVVLVSMFLFLLVTLSSSTAFSGAGSGTEGDPFVITNTTQFVEMSNNLSEYFVLGNDINFSSYGDVNPLGTFTGTLDGQNYTIYSLSDSDACATYNGIFAGVNGGVLQNLNLVGGNATCSGDNRRVAYLASNVQNANFTNITLRDITVLTTYSGTGGVFSGMVAAEASNFRGENIRGYNLSMTSSALFSGILFGEIDAGSTPSFLDNIYLDENSVHLENGFSRSYKGCLASYLTGDVTVNNTIIKCTQNRTAEFSGGFAGRATTGVLFDNSVFAGKLINPAQSKTGGFIATTTGVIIRNSRVENATISTDSGGTLGGFIGQNTNANSTIENSAVINSTISGSSTYGGFVGYVGLACCTVNEFVIRNSYVDNLTQITTNAVGSYIGGLIGRFVSGSHVSNGDTFTNLLIEDSYSLATINLTMSSGTPNIVGGILGQASTGTTAVSGVIINRTYSGGNIFHNGASNIGAIVGQGSGGGIPSTFVNHTYFNNETGNVTSDSYGGVAATTADLQTQGTYSTWDFNNTWVISSLTNGGYPMLRSTPSEPIQDGSCENPFLIATPAELNNTRNNLSACYKLTADIDLNVSPYNTGTGWVPIGDDTNVFTGNFDGQGYTISNLYINATGNYKALFGGATGASFGNITFTNIYVEGGSNYQSALVGIAQSVDFYNISVSGVMTDVSIAGAVAGRLQGGTANYITSNISMTSRSNSGNIGSIIGYVYLAGDINNSVSYGDVYCYDDSCGGLVGIHDGGLYNSVAYGDVRGVQNVGGAVGAFRDDNEFMINVAAYGDVNATQDNVGGVAGLMRGEARNVTATGNVYLNSTTSGQLDVGGLFGSATNTNIYDSYATGDVYAISSAGVSEYVGGLTGYTGDAIINNSYATGDVYATGDYVSSFIPYMTGGSISYSYSTGNVEGRDHVSGLLSRAEGGTDVTYSYATGNVTCTSTGNAFCGALGGYWTGGSHNNVYATGNVNATGDGNFVGGLLGRQYTGSMSNAYSRGTVDSDGDYVAGFIGYSSSITDSYSASPVYSIGGTSPSAFVSVVQTGSITNSYWDNDTSILPSSPGGGTALTTAEIQDENSLTGFDFSSIWRQSPLLNDGYPCLQYFENCEIIEINNVVLSSSNNTNTTNENLSVTFSVSGNAGSVKNITDWRYDNSTTNRSLAVLNMPFERGSNSTYTQDLSTFGNNGTVSGATWNATGGYDGFGAYEFDGNQDYIQIADHSSLRPTDAITVLARIKASSTTGSQEIISSQGGNNNYALSLDGTTPTFAIRNSANTTWYNATHSAISTDTWYSLVGVFNGSAVQIYVDAVAGTSAAYSGTMPSGSQTLAIGANAADTSTQEFSGTIDEVQIYDRALSPEQIQALYNNQTTTLVSQETNQSEMWQACGYAFDGRESTGPECSNTVTIADPPLGYIPVTGCYNLSSSDTYVVTTNISTTQSSPCFKINASNIIFNISANVAAPYAFLIENADDVTIHTTDSNVTNSSTAFNMTNASNVLIDLLTFPSSNGTSQITDSTNITFSYIDFDTFTGTLQIDDSSGIILNQSIIASTSSSQETLTITNTNDSQILGGTYTSTKTTTQAFSFTHSHDWTLQDSSFSTSSTSDIILFTNSSSVVIQNTTVTSSSGGGTPVTVERTDDATLIGSTLSANVSSALSLSSNSTNLTAYNNTFKSGTTTAIELLSGATNSSFYNNIFNTSYALAVTDAAGGNDWNTSFAATQSIIGGTAIGGNFYSDFICYRDDNADNICQEPNNKTINSGDIDYLPLYLTITQIAPSINNLIFNSSLGTNLSTENLQVNYTVTDLNGNATTVNVSWYRNGSYYISNTTTISSSLTSIGQIWQVCVNATDGVLSNDTCSANMTILSPGNVVTGNASTIATSGITGTVNITVANSSNLSAYQNGVQNISLTEDNEELLRIRYNFSRANFPLNFTVKRTATSVVIANLTLNSSLSESKTLYLDKYNTTTSVCVRNADTTDVSQISSDCSGGDETQFNITECESNTTRDGITCRIIDDRFEFSNLSFSGAKSLNQPTIDAVILNSTNGTNYSNENLTANIINASDLDGDSITYLYSWLENASVQSAFNESVLPAANTSVDDIWQVCVTPNDGTQNGTEVCSNNMTILAVPDLTAPNTNISVFNITNQSAIVNLSSNEATNYTINYGTETGSYTQTLTNSSYNATWNVSLTGLDDGITYYLQVITCDSSSNCNTSSELNFTTNDSTAPIIANIQNYSIAGTFARINWTTNEAANATIFFGNQTSNYTNTTTNASYATTHDQQLTGLDDLTTYYYVIRACDNSGNCVNSSEYNFTTLDITAPSFTNTTTINVTNTSATIVTATSENTTITIYYGTSTGTYTNTTENNSQLPAHNTTLTGLSSDQQYFYLAQACDIASNCVNSSEYNFTTIDTIDPTMTNLVNDSITYTSFAVNMTTNEAANLTIFYGTETGNYTNSTTNSSYLLNHYLNITGLQNDTTYYYLAQICDDASNCANSTEYQVTTLDGVAPTLTTIESTAITASSFTLSWNTTEAANTTINYGTSTNNYTFTATNSSYLTEHAYSFASLNDDTTYFIQVINCDSSGNCQTANEVNVTTLDTTAPSTVTNLVAINVTNQSIVWNWTNPSDDDFNATLIYLDGINLANGTNTTYNYTATNLNESTNYTITITTRDHTGNINTTNVTNTTQTLDFTAPIISNVSNSSIAGTSAIINWTTNEAANATVYFGNQTGNYTNTTTNETFQTSHSIALLGLDETTQYFYITRSCDSSGNCANSSEYNFTTLDATAPNITSINATNITNTTAIVRTTTNEAASVTIFYGTSSGSYTNTTANATTIVSHNITLSSLNPTGQQYFYIAELCDASNNCANSTEQNFTTLDTTAPTISNVESGYITDDDTVTISWTTSEAANSTLYYGNESGNYTFTNSSASFVTSHIQNMTNVSTGQVYYYIVRSCDVAGNCANSSEYNVTIAQEPTPTPTPTSTARGAPQVVQSVAKTSATTLENYELSTTQFTFASDPVKKKYRVTVLDIDEQSAQIRIDGQTLTIRADDEQIVTVDGKQLEVSLDEIAPSYAGKQTVRYTLKEYTQTLRTQAAATEDLPEQQTPKQVSLSDQITIAEGSTQQASENTVDAQQRTDEQESELSQNELNLRAPLLLLGLGLLIPVILVLFSYEWQHIQNHRRKERHKKNKNT